KSVVALMEREQAARGMVSVDDLALFRVTDDLETAAAEIEGFYRVFHSERYVGDTLVLRLHRALSPEALDEVSGHFSDILAAPPGRTAGPRGSQKRGGPAPPARRRPVNR